MDAQGLAPRNSMGANQMVSALSLAFHPASIFPKTSFGRPAVSQGAGPRPVREEQRLGGE